MSHVAANKNTDNYICKLIFIAIALFFFTARLAAQNKAAESAEEIRLAIRESSMDTNRISLQLKLGDYYMRHPGEVKNNMDSAINLFNQATVLSIKLHELDWQYNALAMLGTYYAYNGETERSRAIFRRLISYFHQKVNMQKEADAWNWMGDLYNGKKDNQQERLGFYQQARSLYLQSHHLSQAAQTLSGIASIHIETKQYKLAGNELQEVLAEYKASGNKDLQGTYLQLFSFEYARGNYYRAMAYCLEEIENEKASQITPGSAYFYAGAAMCNDAVKKHEEAVKWSRKAMTIERHPVIFLYISKYILIKNLIDLNRIKEARIALNDFSSGKPLRLLDTFYQYRMTALYLDKINKSGLAVRCYVKILELEYKRDIEKEVYEFWSVMCNNETAGIYLKTKLAPKAKKYIDSAAFTFKNAKTALDPEFLVAFYDNSYKYNLATGNYRAAITNLQRRVKLQDSLFTADKDKQLAELNIQYQTAQQELSIKDLHSQGTAQQVRLEKANLQRNITIGGIVVMILVSALFYRNYKQKRSANKIITHKNELLQHLLTEKEWLLKEVH
ncbi:MAG: Two-component sensor histidine kinase, contains HisKA and HATPase domain, partial [Mucilaginibacter sp.]|nr:Two-component sensor histidine kinase, contains HisKA and HATPase domain [Mucilaginibacter sp.]